jgi:molybdate transport system permease protein
MDWPALFLSLRLASACAVLLALAGLPLTFFLSLSNRRRAAFLETLFSLPLVLPPTVLGFYLLLVLGPLKLAFSFWGLLIASLLSGMPFAFQSFLAGFRAIDRRYLERSWTLGEGNWRTLQRVAIPLAKEGIISGAILAFAHTLGEFGVVLMIGGNIPNVSRTLSIALYDQVESFEYGNANRTALILLVFSLVCMTAVSTLRRKAVRE